jgi:hypothetical protein
MAFCLVFFGFINNIDCPIWNYNPPNNSPHQDQGSNCNVINIYCIILMLYTIKTYHNGKKRLKLIVVKDTKIHKNKG